MYTGTGFMVNCSHSVTILLNFKYEKRHSYVTVGTIRLYVNVCITFCAISIY